MVFIDGSNFYHALRIANLPINADFGHLISEIVGKERELVRAYYYNASLPPDDDAEQYERQRLFFEELKEISYFELRLSRLERRDYGLVEKGSDVMLAVDMVMYAAKDLYDVAILISGDGDFTPAIRYVKDMGKHVELAYPKEAKAYALKQVCDKFIPLQRSHLIRQPQKLAQPPQAVKSQRQSQKRPHRPSKKSQYNSPQRPATAKPAGATAQGKLSGDK
ncbi:MAG: hypothetical protein Kow0090_20820 [Myxococcota bacterium]